MKNSWRNSKLVKWLFFEGAMITIMPLVAYVIPYCSFKLLSKSGLQNYSAYALLTFLPMTVLVGVTAYCFSRRFNRVVSGLTKGLRSVADGDFTIRLNTADGGPLSEAYADFNTMAEDLQSIQTLRKDFINNFSHEFKTPITAIRGFAELLQESDLTTEDRQQYLQVISDESSRLADLTNSTLLLSKLESQQVILNKTSFPLDEQIKRCAILLSSTWEQKHLAFSADLDPIQYTGSEELMRHVWLNLLNNAIKYTPDGGEVSITLRADGPEIAVTVADTGIGMPEQVRAHMFDKYYQGDPSHTGKGLGLGLSIVHRIVDLCGGRIETESIVNQGSSFTVFLPKTEQS